MCGLRDFFYTHIPQWARFIYAACSRERVTRIDDALLQIRCKSKCSRSERPLLIDFSLTPFSSQISCAAESRLSTCCAKDKQANTSSSAKSHITAVDDKIPEERECNAEESRCEPAAGRDGQIP